MNKTIPTHDPYTGELNPYYEELTGQPNPLSVKNEVPSTFDLNQLVGKKFRYKSKYGLSTWTDTVKAIEPHMTAVTDPALFFKINGDFEFVGYQYILYVRATRSKNIYEFENCIFKDV